MRIMVATRRYRMTQTNTLQDARTFWSIRTGAIHRRMRQELGREARAALRPGDTESRRNVADLVEGQVIGLWLAAAVRDPAWAERMAAWLVNVAPTRLPARPHRTRHHRAAQRDRG